MPTERETPQWDTYLAQLLEKEEPKPTMTVYDVLVIVFLALGIICEIRYIISK